MGGYRRYLRLFVLACLASGATTATYADISLGVSARVGSQCSAHVDHQEVNSNVRKAIIYASCNHEAFTLIPTLDDVVVLSARSDTMSTHVDGTRSSIDTIITMPGRHTLHITYTAPAPMSGILVKPIAD